MSDPVRDRDADALDELERIVRALGGELAGWRARALAAEERVRVIEATVSPTAVSDAERLRSLEEENATLHARVAAATERTATLLARVRFLRQQQEQEVNR